ncbi:MAG: hypothetical protein IKG93_08995 [Clostridiales bacterium]|nr:hypothetical protein [Clostridiales bacterium]
MNAKRFIVIMLFFIILTAFFIWIVGVSINDASRKKRLWREKAQEVTDAVEKINAKKYDIMVYGDVWNGPKDLIARQIMTFEQDDLIGPDPNFEHVGHMLIINDLSGKNELSLDTWRRIHDLLQYDNYVVVYLGNAQLPAMQETGFFFDVYPKSTNSLVAWNGGLNYEVGFADNSSLIPGVVLESLSSDRIPSFAMVMKMARNNYL